MRQIFVVRHVCEKQMDARVGKQISAEMAAHGGCAYIWPQ